MSNTQLYSLIAIAAISLAIFVLTTLVRLMRPNIGGYHKYSNGYYALKFSNGFPVLLILVCLLGGLYLTYETYRLKNRELNKRIEFLDEVVTNKLNEDILDQESQLMMMRREIEILKAKNDSLSYLNDRSRKSLLSSHERLKRYNQELEKLQEDLKRIYLEKSENNND